MPIYEFECMDCHQTMEILVASTETDLVACGSCGSKNLRKLISAHAPVSGAGTGFPDTPSARCCGSSGPSSSCTGPGSCCGRN